MTDVGRTHSYPRDTELIAAREARRLTSRREAVLHLLREATRSSEHGGLTDDEGAELLGWHDRLTFGRRRNELLGAGLVEDSGRRRQTPALRPAIVWRATS